MKFTSTNNEFIRDGAIAMSITLLCLFILIIL